MIGSRPISSIQLIHNHDTIPARISKETHALTLYHLHFSVPVVSISLCARPTSTTASRHSFDPSDNTISAIICKNYKCSRRRDDKAWVRRRHHHRAHQARRVRLPIVGQRPAGVKEV